MWGRLREQEPHRSVDVVWARVDGGDPAVGPLAARGLLEHRELPLREERRGAHLPNWGRACACRVRQAGERTGRVFGR
eukprot:2918836-Prymnesium_polylepis.1